MVHIEDLEWDDWNEEHIARHRVDLEEADQVARGASVITRGRGGTFRVIGQTDGGRYLTHYVARRSSGLLYVVSARDSTSPERRAYLRH